MSVNNNWMKEDDECPTYFGINIQKASPEVREIIQDCIRREKRPQI